MLLNFIPEWYKAQGDKNKQLIEEIKRIDAENKSLLRVRESLIAEGEETAQKIVKSKHALASLDQEVDLVDLQIKQKAKALEERINELDKMAEDNILGQPYPIDS